MIISHDNYPDTHRLPAGEAADPLTSDIAKQLKDRLGAVR